MLSKEEFIEYYRINRKLPYPLNLTTKRKLTDKELEIRYKNYKDRIEKGLKGIKKTSNSSYILKLNKVLKEIHLENNLEPYKRFYNKLKIEYKKILDSLMFMCPKDKNTNKIIFDAAHYIERSKNKKLAIDKSNIVLLPRPLHLALDSKDNIFLNRKMTEEEHSQWWEIILTKERKEELDRKNKEN